MRGELLLILTLQSGITIVRSFRNRIIYFNVMEKVKPDECYHLSAKMESILVKWCNHDNAFNLANPII